MFFWKMSAWRKRQEIEIDIVFVSRTSKLRGIIKVSGCAEVQKQSAEELSLSFKLMFQTLNVRPVHSKHQLNGRSAN